MISSGSGTKNRIDPAELGRKIKQIGGGELEIWKHSALADEELFSQLYQLTYSKDHKIAWRSCWIIDTTAEASPGRLIPYLPEIIDRLSTEKSGSIKRHFTRILSRYDIPEECLGQLVDTAFRLLSPSEAIAVRANAMQILYNIALREPDLKGELASVIESILDEGGTPGLVSRARKLLRELARDNQTNRGVPIGFKL